MTLIYRIEDALGRGPYNGDGFDVIIHHHDTKAFCATNQPPPDRDGLDDYFKPRVLFGERPLGDAAKWGTHGHFGFGSRKELLDWFPADERASLDKVGYRVAVYDAPDSAIHAGHRQVFFHMTEAKLVRTEPLAAFAEKETADA